MGRGPRTNDHFPIGESLSPPIVDPVSECAEAVSVHGFLPHATVRVWAGVTELLAEEEPPFGFEIMTLKRRVKLGESLTATQTVGVLTSLHSTLPAVVGPLPETAVKTTKPDVGDDLFACGVVVPVGNLVPGGVRVRVTERDPAPGGATDQIASEPAALSWHAVFTKPLHAGRFVSARQVACEGTTHEALSPPADEVFVKTAPSPTPPPDPPDPYSLIPGNDAVTLAGLFVGAGIQIFDSGVKVCSGWMYTTASANVFPLTAPLTGGPVTATQQLCGPPSKESTPVTPKGTLTALTVLDPICAGARFVMVRGSTVNATIVLLRNGSVLTSTGSGPGDVPVALSGNQVLNAGDVVTAFQYLGPATSPPSNNANVVGALRAPVIEVLGGEPFFWARAHEEPIDGPVFPRGRGPGPVIRVQGCCSKGVHAEVLAPDGKLVAELALSEIVPGYYSATWPWSSASNWAVPGGIPVGRYTVVARTGCQQEEGRATFYVIFNPAEVNGPPRFSFDDTAVWFAASHNALFGLHYFLHQSDRRVFNIAVNAASGMTDSYAAAVAIARAEEGLFGYTVTSGTQDVLDQLLNRPEAQCADDACFLVSLLRAMGIPAHPVTADAAAETGGAHWGFDTWLEFLAPQQGTTEWRALHPHEYPGMQPESRATFGLRGVATNQFNDLIVMANESWPFAPLDDGTNDIDYGRQPCGQPHQNLNKPAWIDEICEQGYWVKSHWDCAAIQPRSLAPGEGFRLEGGDLAFGGRVSGSVDLINPTKERVFGRLVVDLVSVRKGVKSLTDETFSERVLPSVAIDPGRSVRVSFDWTLPQTLPPGSELWIRARLNDRIAAAHRLSVASRVAATVDLPSTYVEGESAIIRAVVTNTSRETLRNVTIDLVIPFALESHDRTLRRLESLGPYEAREVSWTVRAIAQLRSASAHVSVGSANGGGVRVSRPFVITGRGRPIAARPGVTPERQR